MSQTTAKHLVPGSTAEISISQQPQSINQPLQPFSLSQNENCQESKVVYIVVEVPEQNVQGQKKKTQTEGHCIITPKSGQPKPKVRVTARRGHTASAPVAQKNEVNRHSASKENVEKTQGGANRHSSAMASTRYKADLAYSNESVPAQGRKSMPKHGADEAVVPDSRGFKVTEACVLPAEAVTVDAPHDKKQNEGVPVTVSTPKSTLTSLLTSPDLDLLVPMATSTPLSRNLKKRSSMEAKSHLPKTAKVSLQFAPCSSQESDVPTSRTIPVSVSCGSHSDCATASTESPLVAAHHSHLTTSSPLSSALTHLPQTSPASTSNCSKDQFASQAIQTPYTSQTSAFSQICTDKMRESLKGQSKDSGIGTSVLSQVLTSVSTAEEVSRAHNSATGFCTSETSEDSNQKMVIQNLSVGSLDEESSNSQGGEGELNTSLTKMHWLKDYALKKKVLGSEHLLFPEGPANRRLEARQKKDMCSCGILREAAAKKPGYTYKHMIQMSMVSKKNKPMMAQEIRTYFTKNWTFFKSHQTCLFWQNAIRHNLSSNDCFVKCPGRKGYWFLDPDEYQELKLKEASLFNTSQGHMRQVLDPMLIGQNSKPVVFSSALPASAQSSGPPSSFGSSGIVRRTGYAPILPRQVLNISNQSPALIQQNSPVYIHYPALSVQPSVFPAITISSTLPKRPLPPLPATASRGPTHGRKKTKPVRGKDKGRAAVNSKDSKMKKTKSTSDVGVHGDLIAQAAIESGLLDGSLDSKDDSRSASISSLGIVSSMSKTNPDEAGTNEHITTSSMACLILPRSTSMPPILSKRKKVLPPSTTPVICVSPEKRTCSSPPHSHKQRSRGRRKQNFLPSSNKSTDLIITGSGLGSRIDLGTKVEEPDLPATTDSSGDNVVDTSTSLTGLEAAQFQVSLMSPTSRNSPEPPLGSLASDLGPTAGKQKGEKRSLPSPISSGASQAVESVPADDSGLIMVDFAQCGIDSSSKKLVLSPNKSSLSFDMSVLNTPPSKSWPLKSPTTPGDFNFDFLNFVFKRSQLSGESEQQDGCSTMITQPHGQQDYTTAQSLNSWQPAFQSSTANKTSAQEKNKTTQLVGNQQLNGLQHQQVEHDWLSEYLGTLPATSSGSIQLLSVPQTSLAQHTDNFFHTSQWHLPSSQSPCQSQQSQHSQIHQFSPQTGEPKQDYVSSSQSEWRPSSAPPCAGYQTQQSPSNQGFSALQQDTSQLHLPQPQKTVHEASGNSALNDSFCFQEQFARDTAPVIPSKQVSSCCHMSLSESVGSGQGISSFPQFAFAGPTQPYGTRNASRKNDIACTSCSTHYCSQSDVACLSSVSEEKPYLQYGTANNDSKPINEPNHSNISLDISCFDDFQTLQNNSFPSQCASSGSPTLPNTELPSFHSAELPSFQGAELPSFHNIGSPTFHGAGSPAFQDAGSPGFHSALSSSFHSSMLPSFHKTDNPAENWQKQSNPISDTIASGTMVSYNFACDNSPLSGLSSKEGGASVYSALGQMSNMNINQSIDLHQQIVPLQARNNSLQQQNYMHTIQSQSSGMPAFLASVVSDFPVPVKQEQ